MQQDVRHQLVDRDVVDGHHRAVVQGEDGIAVLCSGQRSRLVLVGEAVGAEVQQIDALLEFVHPVAALDGLEDEDVPFAGAEQLVHASPAVQQILAGAAAQNVVGVAAVERVVPAAARQHVLVAFAEHLVVAPRPLSTSASSPPAKRSLPEDPVSWSVPSSPTTVPSTQPP
ncbi:hypothetical protein P2H44_01670 [Albimonas sp. CAU 1670]|uniref:hypothetical protein n=1 Tax=Albimonas sp. CAU 1670 TaxID=3032599 RepID=UPI0023DB47AF|nr:hypothetical protein [Albimonas sp. CAU 1670]MDF2231254.1 hypothetical protein [Albimonas sp. CAU 1670]